MTKAALNALAWTYLRGRMPKHVHRATWWAVYECLTGAGSDALKPECVQLIADHPMVLKVRELEADGWKLDPRDRNTKVRLGVELFREHEGRRQETRVYPDGKQGRIF